MVFEKAKLFSPFKLRMKRLSLPRWSLSAGGLVLALGAGVVIGRISSPDEGGNGSAGADSSRTAGRGGSLALTLEERARQRREEGRTAAHTADNADLAQIMSSTNRLERTQRLLAFLDRLPTDQFAGVYEEMRNSPLAGIQGSERSLILQAWAERDPLGALGFLQEKGAQDWERETAVATWAAKDPQAALSWALSAEDEGGVNNWQLGVARGVASTNPELARDLLAQLEGRTRDRAIREMEPYVMQYGFDYARDWIAGISDEGIRGEASRRLARNLTELDPEQTAAWNTAIADTELRRSVSEDVASAWARNDLSAARNWVETLPDDTKSEAAEGIARHYARQNPAEAAQWLAGLGNNPDLDGARRIFIEESFRRAPEESLNFVANLSNERMRNEYYHRYVSGWMRNDATAARSWVNENSQLLPRHIVERANR